MIFKSCIHSWTSSSLPLFPLLICTSLPQIQDFFFSIVVSLLWGRILEMIIPDWAWTCHLLASASQAMGLLDCQHTQILCSVLLLKHYQDQNAPGYLGWMRNCWLFSPWFWQSYQLSFLIYSIVSPPCPSTETGFDRRAQLHQHTSFPNLACPSCPNWVWSLLNFWVIILYTMTLLKSTERIILNIAPPSLPFTWFTINLLLKQVFVLLIKDFVFSKFYSFIFSGLSWKTFLWVSRSTFSWGMNSNHGLCCQGTCISFSYVHEIVPLWCFLFSVSKTVVNSCPLR